MESVLAMLDGAEMHASGQISVFAMEMERLKMLAGEVNQHVIAILDGPVKGAIFAMLDIGEQTVHKDV